MDLSHLTAKTQAVLDQPIEERLAYIRKDSWVPYPRATAILQQLEELLNYPKCDRMPNLAICARTNNGKTRLIKHFLSEHKATDNVAGDAVQVPILYLQCPGVPDESRLYDAILSRLFKKFRPTASPREKLPIVLGILADVEVRVIAVDEANFAEAGSMDRQKTFLNALRYIANELRISIVTLGTEEMMRVIRSVPAFENRSIPAFLPRWECDNDFRQLLASFEMLLPLKNPSRLYDKKFATLLHSRSEGTIGELKMLLAALAEKAMRSGKEMITEEMVDDCGYRPPSLRKREVVPV